MKSYRPEELFDENGTLIPELAELAPKGDRRMGANPHANGGLLLKDLRLPDFRTYAVEVPKPGGVEAEATRVQGDFLRDVLKMNADRANFRIFSPDETNSNRWNAVFEVTNRESVAEIYPERRPRRRRRPGDGDALRAPVPGLARRLPADRPARVLLVLRGVHPHHRRHVQPARQVARVVPEDPLAAAGGLAQLPAHLARLAAGPQRLQPPGPRLHRPRRQQEGQRRPGLPPARRQHPALGDRPLPEEPELRQRGRRRQAALAAVARHGVGGPALHGRDRHLGVGQQRPRGASPTS